MRAVGIKVLKDKLSEYLRAVAFGETIVVTDRGRVVAELVPPRVHDDASSAEQELARLVRDGLLQPARIPPGTPLPRRRPVAKLADILRDLDDSRAD